MQLTPSGQDPSKRVVALQIGVGLIALAVGIGVYALTAPQHLRIVALELAGSGTHAARIVASRRSDYTTAVQIDFALIAGYAAGIWLLCRAGAAAAVTATVRSRYMIAGALALIGAALDALENAFLLHGLHDGNMASRDYDFLGAQTAAVAKFACITASGLLAVVALVWVSWRLVRSPAATSYPAITEMAMSDAARRTAVGGPHDWHTIYGVPPSRPLGGTGICLSGGGIRSAAVSLGALQALQREGRLQTASYLVSVSGGGYLAGAVQLALHGDLPGSADVGGLAATADDVYERGSVEEGYTRRHGEYIAEGARGWLLALGVLLRGVLANWVVLATAIATVAIGLNEFYRKVSVVQLSSLRPRFALSGDSQLATPSFPHLLTGAWTAAGAVAVLAVSTYVIRAAVFAFRPHGNRRIVLLLRKVSFGAAGLSLLWLVVGVGLPALFWVTARVTWLASSHKVAAGGGASALLGYLGALVGLLWRNRKSLSKRAGGVFGAIKRGPVGQVLPFSPVQMVIVIAVLAVIAAVALVCLGWGATTVRQWPREVGIGYGVAVLFVALVDQSQMSLHPFYRRRLASAFAVRRAYTSTGDIGAEAYSYDRELTRLTEYAAPVPDFPHMIFAAAANVSGHDLAPPGRRAVSYTFSHDFVGGSELGWVRTGALEETVNNSSIYRDLTVQSAMVISGAAFASAMGAQARPYTTLFTLTNARLGAWLPNPRYLRAIADDPGGSRWALPRLPHIRNVNYLLRELIGHYSPDARLLLCTDGGHYDNLGLIELLKLRCETIFCIDASGDAPPLATTLGGTLALARELGIDITFDEADAQQLIPGCSNDKSDADCEPLASRLSQAAVMVGRIHYPAVGEDGVTGTIVFAKTSLTRAMPYDVKTYAETHPVFPRDTTGDQWFSADQFDAYQTVGDYLGTHAIQALERARTADTEG